MIKGIKKIVCIGGGTGTFTVLSGLKKYNNLSLAAIVTMADDGGSSGILRDELGVLPPGDVRQCLVALSSEDQILRQLFNYRFGIGPFIGHNFGNIFMASLEKITGSFKEAVESAGRLLNIKGEVIPVTLEKTKLGIQLDSGKKIIGENKINKFPSLSEFPDKRIFLQPVVKANPKAIAAIKKADVIIMGPGNIFCSIIPNLVVGGIAEAIKKSKAVKIYNCNLMTKKGHTDNFKVEDFIEVIEQYLGKGTLDYVTFNIRKPSNIFLKKYSQEGEFVGFNKKSLLNKKFKGENLISNKITKLDPADVLIKRTLIRHDSDKLAKLIIKLCK
ncbi:MAG: YvcK family protein [Candidatus Parcubacteria bacterium]|nr:YvcK family protein [Candidatus Parcubacteria bacterium]